MSKYEGPERRGWHVKKEISLGDVMAFISAALAVIYAYFTLDKRVTILEQAAIVQAKLDVRQDDDFFRYQSRIDEHLKAISAKLDRLIERGR
jgi:hypothetical protein